MEKHELSKFDFEMIDDAFRALLQAGHPDPVAKRLSTCAISFATLSPGG